MKLADVYASNIFVWSCGGINVQARDIVHNLQYAQKQTRTTLNSTVDSTSLPTKTYTGPQWAFTAPAEMIVVDPNTGRDETVSATLTLGIKPDCMNLQPIAISYDQGEKWYNITNGTAGIPLRIPLSYSSKQETSRSGSNRQ